MWDTYLGLTFFPSLLGEHFLVSPTTHSLLRLGNFPSVVFPPPIALSSSQSTWAYVIYSCSSFWFLFCLTSLSLCLCSSSSPLRAWEVAKSTLPIAFVPTLIFIHFPLFLSCTYVCVNPFLSSWLARVTSYLNCFLFWGIIVQLLPEPSSPFYLFPLLPQPYLSLPLLCLLIL